MINAQDYTTRDELEKYVINTYGRSTEIKKEILGEEEVIISIEGTPEELRRLNLRHGQMVWGVPVRATEYEQKQEPNQFSRGEVKPSIINGLISKNANKSKVG